MQDYKRLQFNELKFLIVFIENLVVKKLYYHNLFAILYKRGDNMLENILSEEYNEDTVKEIIEGYCKRITSFRINSLHPASNPLKELDAHNIKYEQISWYNNAYIILNNEEKIRELKCYEEGDIYLQSLSSMLPPLILAPQVGEQILDMTAAPGSKTSEIAALTNNQTLITAVEKNKQRKERLKYNLNKLGVQKCNIIQADARHLDEWYRFDKILLDAPCSGSGTLEDIKSFDEDLYHRITNLQKELIDKAVKLLKEGGELVYSTCSILKNENEDIINYILANNNLELVNIPKDNYKEINLLPSTIKEALKVKPTKYYEGFFVCKLKKVFNR